jgi:nucleoside-diphosphate-sugar epimerase
MAFTKVALSLARGQAFELYGDGEQTRGWTFVGDVVDATIRALDSGRGVYNVGGGVEASLSEAIGILEALAGTALQIASTRRYRATNDARTPTRRGFAPSSAGRPRCRWRRVFGPSGSGRRLRSPRHESRPEAGSAGRAGG